MRQYIILGVAILTVLGLNFWQTRYLRETSEYLLSDAWAIENSIRREDYNSAKQELKALESTWNDVKPGWDIFGEHDDIEQISESLASIRVYIDNKESTEIANENAILMEQIEHVIDSETFKFENVF